MAKDVPVSNLSTTFFLISVFLMTQRKMTTIKMISKILTIANAEIT
jgi:hypothetical protein